MNIELYINELLYRHDCVIVPGFGGFITNKISAILNTENQTFNPPSKQISFNSFLKHNDGLLANHISKNEHISFEEATKQIALTVSKWNKELQTNPIKILNIGKLVFNKEHQLVFEPSLSVNFLPGSFGLATVKATTIKRQEPIVKPMVTVPVEEKKTLPIFVKYAASAAILLGLSIPFYNGYKNHQQDVLYAKQAQLVADKIQKATFIITEPLPTVQLTVHKKITKPYHVIAGSFKYVENAERKVAQLISKGYDASIVGVNDWGLTQVAFSSFQNRNDAINTLYKIQKTTTKDAWFLEKR